MTATRSTFVARERQLQELDEFLESALARKPLMAFVTGEAGSGKTALVTEFARRSQKSHKDLLVAVGNCNAQIGIGDPYLPFREVLGLLTGDVGAKLAQGAISEVNARRLVQFLRISGQALVEIGPDLIDVFVPGAGLATRAGKVVAKKLGWLDRLEKLGRRGATPGGSHGLEQSHVFEQYAKVLHAISEQKPLVLVVDDLQWADVSSISLLFHLSRRLGESRILIVGTYRPEDVALGRAGEPHPLSGVLSESKRYFGDIWVSLGQTQETEGRAFVDALLDIEPNRLGENFRQALFEHTGGQALFTVELMKDMKERGDLVQDSKGSWVETPALAWDAMPTRVEGVIEVRIGRLEDGLREMLNIACVEGEDFTAQVVARIQEVQERQLLRSLSRDLERRHRLVCGWGEVPAGGRLLSRYCFTHALFQQYLYQELGAGERRLLHAEVAAELEALYGAHTDEACVQLAHHFAQAGLWEKALQYITICAHKVREAYANHEAIRLYTRALELSSQPPLALDEAQLIRVYEGRGLVWMLLSKYDEAIADFLMMRQMASTLEDRRTEGESLYHLANSYFMKFSEDQYRAEEYAREALQVSEQSGDQRTYAKSLAMLGFVHQARAELRRADHAFEESLHISKREGFVDALAPGLMMLGHQRYWQGDFGHAVQLAHEGVDAAREVHDGFNELFNLTLLSQSLASSGSYGQAQSVLQEALALAKQRENHFFIGRLTNTLGWIHREFGDLSSAMEHDQQSVDLGRMHGISNVEISALINLGLDNSALGRVESARSILEPTLERVRREAFGAHRWRWQVRLLIGLAEALFAAGAYEDALPYAEEGVKEAEATSSITYLARGWALQAKILAGLGRAETVGSGLERAFALADDLRSPALIYPLAYELAQWLEDAGHERRAATLYGRALAATEQMEAAVEDQALRSTFLQLALVQEVQASFARTH